MKIKDLLAYQDKLKMQFVAETRVLNTIAEIKAANPDLDDRGAFDAQVKQLMVGSRVPRPDARDEFDEGRGKGFGSMRMTRAEAEDFLGRYEIVQAKGNDGTGAAGVILLDKVATLSSGQPVVTLAIRSTEFLPLHYKNADGSIQRDESGDPARYGDYERDSSANSQIATHGYAFAQIDRMLAYLDQLAADNPGAKFNLVGGSLSGNIVYSLALLRPDLVSQEAGSNVIFNGTGVGLINGSDVTTAKMQDLMGAYRAAYTNPNDIDLSTIADESKRQTLQTLKNMATQEHQEKLGSLGPLSDQQRYELMKSPNDSGTFQGNDYTAAEKFAAEYAAQTRNTSGILRSTVLGGEPVTNSALNMFTAYYGRAIEGMSNGAGSMEDREVIANVNMQSQNRVQIPIMGNPVFEGGGPVGTMFGNWPALLDGSDAANNHAFATLRNTGAVLDLFAQAAPDMTTDQFDTVFRAAGAQKAKFWSVNASTTDASGQHQPVQGIEGDTLPKMVDALGRILGLDLQTAYSGVNGASLNMGLYENLNESIALVKARMDSLGLTGQLNIVAIDSMTPEQLAQAIHDPDVGANYRMAIDKQVGFIVAGGTYIPSTTAEPDSAVWTDKIATFAQRMEANRQNLGDVPVQQGSLSPVTDDSAMPAVSQEAVDAGISQAAETLGCTLDGADVSIDELGNIQIVGANGVVLDGAALGNETLGFWKPQQPETVVLASVVSSEMVVFKGHAAAVTADYMEPDLSTLKIDEIVSINGQALVNGELLNAALQDANINAKDILLGRGTGELTQLIVAADSSDSDGFTPAAGYSDQAGQETAWYETADAKRFGSTLAEVQSLIAALKGGGPLPIAVGVFNLAARASRSAELGTLAGGINTLASLQGLTNALERGDEIGALASGATFVKNAYAQFFKDSVTQGIEALGGIDTARALAELGDEAAADLVQTFEVFENLDTALPYLNLINAISKGDEVGIATSSLFILEALGYSWAGPVGWAIVGIQLLSSLFDDDVEISGDAVFSANGDGKRVQAVLTAQGADGGGSTVMSVMDNLLAGLQTVINTQLPEGDWGLIASRLPWLHFTGYEGGGGIFSMSWSDGQSGAVHTRQFNVDGDYLGSSDVAEIANSEDFHKSMGQQFIEIATGKFQGDAALVQGWESQTAYAQATRGYDEPVYETQWMESDSGGSYQQVQVGTRHVGGINDPLAGYNTEQRARAQGLWLGSNPGDATPGNAGGINSNNNQSSTQSAHPIVLDLDGNGISITTKAQGGSVLVDVDDDGFAEESDWINPRDGMLVIDKNGDGQISGGAEMFNDAQVNMAARGLNALQALDADGDNKITGSDFAFNQLRVWQDINHDGVAQSYELASLSAKGITELNIGNGQQGQFVMGGVGRGMQATALSADSAGFITQNLGNSLLLIRETGEASLLASALADYGQSTDAAVRAAHSHASADGVLSVVDELMDGLEDTAIKVSAAANMERWRLVA